jgi:hypothetical protein
VPAAILQRYPSDAQLGQIGLPKHPLWPAGAPPIGFHQPNDDFLTAFADVWGCLVDASTGEQPSLLPPPNRRCGLRVRGE